MTDKYAQLFGFTQQEFNDKAIKGNISHLLPKIIGSSSIVTSYNVPATRSIPFIFALAKDIIDPEDIPAFGGGDDEKAAIVSSYLVVPVVRSNYMLVLEMLLMSGMKVISKEAMTDLSDIVEEGKHIEIKYQPTIYKSLTPIVNKTIPVDRLTNARSCIKDGSCDFIVSDVDEPLTRQNVKQTIGSEGTYDPGRYVRIIKDDGSSFYAQDNTNVVDRSMIINDSSNDEYNDVISQSRRSDDLASMTYVPINSVTQDYDSRSAQNGLSQSEDSRSSIRSESRPLSVQSSRSSTPTRSSQLRPISTQSSRPLLSPSSQSSISQQSSSQSSRPLLVPLSVQSSTQPMSISPQPTLVSPDLRPLPSQSSRPLSSVRNVPPPVNQSLPSMRTNSMTSNPLVMSSLYT